LASKYSKSVDEAEMLKPADRFWRNLTRGVRVRSAKDSADALAVDTALPWLAHDGMIHLTAPHGLEQYTGGAWGTRDVCQGSIELLLTLEHDHAVKDILRILFAQQYEESGDWPQWFMLEPYSVVQDRESHGDIIIWPLKALCDYIEATGDFAFLEEAIAWRRGDNFEKTPHADPVTAHIDKLIETVRARFIPGTHLVRYGHGDWNDSLRPVDPTTSDWMTSAWTVVLLYEQLRRYAEILRQAKRAPKQAKELDALRGDGRRAWGSQIRNYVLYPYQNVKDVRTGFETGNTTAVLDGEIDEHTSGDIRQHLDECGPCLREYGLEEAVKRLVAKHCGCDPVPSELRTKVQVRIRQVQAEIELIELAE